MLWRIVMHALTRSVIFIILLLMPAARLVAQAQEAKEPTASITGRVTVGGKPAAGITVTLTESNPDSLTTVAGLFASRAMVKTTTDEEGRFRLEKLAAGRYSMTPFAPAFVIPSEPNSGWPPGRIVHLDDGEALEKVDFALTRGGVITGRVTNADGRPVVGEIITLANVDETTKKTRMDPLAASPFGKSMYMTDDRGIYRLYGLPAGRYILSIGAAEGAQSFNLKSRFHAQTFHPGVTDKAKAAIVELKEGGEATGADIRLGLASQTYKASGRVIDADTGKPIPAAVANYGSTAGDAKMVMPRGLGALANSKGEFKIDTLVPGRYHAFASFDEDTDSYSDLTPFEITSGDVTGLVVKVHRGQSVSGLISIEGTNDPETIASLSKLQVGAYVMGNDPTAPRMLTAKIAPDGSFRIAGVQPGKLRIYVNRFFVPTKLAVLRVERNGITQSDGIQISANESPADIRIILANASGVVRGQITFADGAMADDARLEVTAHRVGGTGVGDNEQAEVDASGRFKFENLLPGDYELAVEKAGAESAQDKDKRPAVSAKQVVTVTNEMEANVTITVDLSPKKK
jgi:Carboxypeptidase regulatory-like domain